jgi:hypothetical protein
MSELVYREKELHDCANTRKALFEKVSFVSYGKTLQRRQLAWNKWHGGVSEGSRIME